MKDVYYLDQNNDIQHFGTKGMKWGYYDGTRNGKRTAREEHYLNEMLNNSINAARYTQLAKDARAKEDAAAAADWKKINKHAQSIKYNVQASKYKDKGRAATRDHITASGLGYIAGFTVGRAVRDCKRQINKAKKWISKWF